MADIKISGLLNATTPLSGSETLPIVQSGNTVKATTQDVANLYSLGYTAENVANKSSDATFTGATNLNYPSQLAVKTYVDSSVASVTGWSLSGNNGTSSTTNFIGTKDAQDLVFKVNNLESMRLDNVVPGRATLQDSLLIIKPSGSAQISYNSLLFNNNTAGSLNIVPNISTNANILQVPDKSGTIATIDDILIKTIKVSLTSANILALNDFNRFQIIPAPGNGKFINLISIFFKYNYVTTAYTGANSVFVKYNNNNTTVTAGEGLSSTNNLSKFLSVLSTTSSAGYNNDSVVLSNNSMSYPTGGDSTVDIYVTYNIITL